MTSSEKNMRILLINLPSERGKRAHFGRLSFQRGTNYGILAIGSILKEYGHHVQLFDPQLWQNVEQKEHQYQKILLSDRWDVIGFSCLTGFSYPYLLKWARIARRLLPKANLIAGGQHHVGEIPARALEECSALDAVVCGEGELPMLQILKTLDDGEPITQIPSVVTREMPLPRYSNSELTTLPTLDYSIYPELKEFPASVEFARGCPFGCSFCVSTNISFRRRSPKSLSTEIKSVCESYNTDSLPMYLETPVFLASHKYLMGLHSMFSKMGISPIWRTETRVDVIPPSYVSLLWDCGLRIIDLGLETASPYMLRLMNKTPNPNRYLSKASKLLKALRRKGIFAKVNILFYAGESPDTISETKAFLDAHRDTIGAISAYPLMMYPGIEGMDRMQQIIAGSGGSLVEDEVWLRRHLTPVNVSRYYTYFDIMEIAHDWEQEFQTAEEYYYQRRFGYFAPGVSYKDFIKQVLEAGVQSFPFGLARESHEPAVHTNFSISQ